MMLVQSKFENPFVLSGYLGPDYFCDRQGETATLFNEIRSGSNITIYGRSRMGKTTLSYHLLDTLQIKNQYFDHLFVELFLTNSLQGLVQKLFSSLLKKSGNTHKNWSPKLMDLIRSLGASITFDPISDLPKVSIDIHSISDAKIALHALLDYLSDDRKPWIIVLDDVHRLLNEGDSKTEMVLQQMIEQYPKIRFVFIVNEDPEILSKINDQSNNIFHSTYRIGLQEINSAAYTTFINDHFKQNDKIIQAEAIQYIYNLMRGQTYGIQLLCNRLFNHFNDIKIDQVRQCLHSILAEEQMVFLQINKLITSTQWKLLVAIATEDRVRQPLSSDFIKKYDLKSPSTVQTALKALIKKSLIYASEAYEVQDVLFAKWLKRMNNRQ